MYLFGEGRIFYLSLYSHPFRVGFLLDYLRLSLGGIIEITAENDVEAKQRYWFLPKIEVVQCSFPLFSCFCLEGKVWR